VSLLLVQLSTGNSKTGMLSWRTGPETCPRCCPFRDGHGCYGESGRIPLAIRPLLCATGPDGRNIVSWDGLCNVLRSKPRYYAVRGWDYGNAPSNPDGRLLRAPLMRLARAAAHLQGIAFDHSLVEGSCVAVANRNTIRRMNRIPSTSGTGLTVNLSANGLAHADELAELRIGPVVATVPRGTPPKGRTPDGHRYVQCLQQTGRVQSCRDCMVCAQVHRTFVVTFEAHGQQARRVEQALEQWEESRS
jgi:hypothetical protein